MALKRVYVVVIVMVAVFLLFLGTLAGCGSKPKSVTGRSSAPADAQTAPPGAVKPQLLLFTSPG